MTRSHMDLRAIVAPQSEEIRVAQCGGYFPLTLTLSLGERQQRALRSGNPTGVDCAPRRGGFTLSPRERAGLRGIGGKQQPARRITRGIVELGESSGSRRFPNPTDHVAKTHW